MRGVCTAVDSVMHPSARVSGVDRPRPVGRIAYCLNWTGPKASYGVHNNSVRNLARGINERVFYRNERHETCTLPVEGAFAALAPFESSLRSFRVNAWSLQEVVNSYTGRRRTIYQNAHDSLMVLPLNERDSRLKAFVKAEKIDFSAKPDPAPRIIQPRDPRFNLHFGRYMKPLEGVIYKQMARLYTSPCVAKGFNAEKTGELIHHKWSQFKKPIAISLDASRFDQHVSVDALKWTHKIYRRFVRGADLDRCLGWMYHNRGIGVAKDGVVRYQKDGGRCSGDMDTALGNCVLMVAMLYSLCSTLGIRHECIDNGDDITVFMESTERKRFLSEVKPWFTALGFDIKVESETDVLEQVEFCQTRPVCRDGRYIMVRRIEALTKDTTSLLDMHMTPSWWYAIGECGLALTDGIPIFTELYKWMMRVGKPSRVDKHPLYRCGMTNLATGMTYTGRPISASTRASFAAAYGIDCHRQRLLEEEIKLLGTPAPGKLKILFVDELRNLQNEYFTATIHEQQHTRAAEQEPETWPGQYAA